MMSPIIGTDESTAHRAADGAGSTADGTAAPSIPSAANMPTMSTTAPAHVDEEAALRDLTEKVRDQDDLERDITHQASLAMIQAEDKKDQRRIEKAEHSKAKLEDQRNVSQQRLRATYNNPAMKLRIEKEVARVSAEIELVDKDISDFRTRIQQRHQDGVEGVSGLGTGAGKHRLPHESQREFLIRTGKITPFAKIGGRQPSGVDGELASAILEAEDDATAEGIEDEARDGPQSHQNLRLPGFSDQPETSVSVAESEFSLRPRKKRKLQSAALPDDDFRPSSEPATPESTSVGDESDDIDLTDVTRKIGRKKPSKGTKDVGDRVDFSGIDDGNEAVYQQRLADWVERRSNARHHQQQLSGTATDQLADGEAEWFQPSPDQPDHRFESGLKLPGDIYPSLFDYQKTGVQWLAELYEQRVGGIIGDEMGLGKTGKGWSKSNPLLQ